MTDLVDEIVEAEEELEARILESIEHQRTELRDLCFDLHLRYDDLKSAKSASSLTILDLDACMRSELDRLQTEKRKRLDEFKQLLAQESEICEKLVIKKTESKHGVVPSENDLMALRAHIKELEKLNMKRRADMEKIKEECVALTSDLECSRNDTFAQLILLESVDEMQLGEADIQKAIEFRDELIRKEREILNDICFLRIKIKELWSKLKIDNPSLQSTMDEAAQLVNEAGQPTSITSAKKISKRQIVEDLRREHERCIQLKMENMQKFIEAIRTDIRDLAEKMYYGDKEMKKLKELLTSTDYTENLLEKHEKCVEDMRFHYDENAHLYDKVNKWIRLWNDFMQFEEKTKDPQRFKQRGYNMLEEEKQRKIFQNQLPKLEEELNQLTLDYREMNGGHEFTVYGHSFAEFVHTKRIDYEENKELERKEKQILRDTIKKNETRFGSKPVTPLAIRNAKRKLGGIVENTALNTPGGGTHKSKLLRTEFTPSSRVANVARGLHNTPGNSTKIATKILTTRNIGNPKRKSRTPGKSRLRRSRLLAQNQSNLVHTQQDQNPTGLYQVSKPAVADSTLKSSSAATTSTISLFQSTLSSTTTTTNLTTQSSASLKIARKQHKQHPPLSASSKFTISTNCLMSTAQRMTSTASNTFIEEENYPADMVDITTVNSNSEKNGPDYVAHAAAAKITEMIANGKSVEIQKSCEFGYAEFSRDLPRPIKFGQETTNLISKQLRSQLPRTIKK